MNVTRLFRYVILGVVCAALTGCLYRQAPAPTGAAVTADFPEAIPAEIGQLIVVFPVRSDMTRGVAYLFERRGSGWSQPAGPLLAMVGRKGFARPGVKREGDGRTPSGLFPLEFAFGYDATVQTKMPYRQATGDDLWVDDVQSPDYNQWVRRGSTTATSFEEMKLGDHRYRYGLVIGYNRQPIVPGLGSAIFMHVWLQEGVSTSGCVAVSEADMVAILTWLDPDQKPHILMGDPRHLPLLPGWSDPAPTPVSREQGPP